MDMIRNVAVNTVHNFRNHPFKVEVNMELCELMKSIEKEAAIWSGKTEVSVIIRELDDAQAVMATLGSNMHRKNLKPSAQ